MSMKAINKFIIIEPITEEVVSSSGLVMSAADADDLRYRKGRVISAGHMVESMSSGDEIYYDKQAGHEARLSGSVYTVILERDVVVCL
tara:strand:- start:95 stop:358 length:264 start_codon:yes stop_codon:yes gene_type:complete